MNAEKFKSHAAAFMQDMNELLRTKGNDYSFDEDRLSNFKVIGQLIGQSPMVVWAVFAMKHCAALMTFVQDGSVQDEVVESRFLDLATYALLGCALAKDMERGEDKPIDPSITPLKAQLNQLAQALGHVSSDISRGKIAPATVEIIKQALDSLPAELQKAASSANRPAPEISGSGG